MPKKGYRTITLSEKAYRTIQKERLSGETWDETIEGLTNIPRGYVPFAKFKNEAKDLARWLFKR